jgi:hypothetical protein
MNVLRNKYNDCVPLQADQARSPISGSKARTELTVGQTQPEQERQQTHTPHRVQHQEQHTTGY